MGGTSAATPTFAGIVSLLNDARAAAGKTPLGNLNQLIYAHPEAVGRYRDGAGHEDRLYFATTRDVDHTCAVRRTRAPPPEAFTDITAGSNPGGGGCGYGGFNCAAGWDPVTGMGTPLFPELMEIAMALP